MEIEVRYLYDNNPIVVSTESNDPDLAQRVNYKGGNYPIELLKKRIGETLGVYGHSVNPELTNNLDLLASIRKIDEFEILSVEPAIAPRKLPDSVVS